MKNLRGPKNCQKSAQKNSAADSSTPKTNTAWPDQLAAPESHEVQQLLDAFWHQLAHFPDLHERTEFLLLHNLIHDLRAIIIRMMLAANGVRYPNRTQNLNLYLGESQRAALEKTLLATGTNLPDNFVAQAVALTVIYHWYAPQLAHKYGVQTPDDLTANTLSHLHQSVPGWPLNIITA